MFGKLAVCILASCKVYWVICFGGLQISASQKSPCGQMRKEMWKQRELKPCWTLFLFWTCDCLWFGHLVNFKSWFLQLFMLDHPKIVFYKKSNTCSKSKHRQQTVLKTIGYNIHLGCFAFLLVFINSLWKYESYKLLTILTTVIILTRLQT